MKPFTMTRNASIKQKNEHWTHAGLRRSVVTSKDASQNQKIIESLQRYCATGEQIDRNIIGSILDIVRNQEVPLQKTESNFRVGPNRKIFSLSSNFFNIQAKKSSQSEFRGKENMIEMNIHEKSSETEKHNRILSGKIAELEKEVKSLRKKEENYKVKQNYLERRFSNMMKEKYERPQNLIKIQKDNEKEKKKQQIFLKQRYEECLRIISLQESQISAMRDQLVKR